MVLEIRPGAPGPPQNETSSARDWLKTNGYMSEYEEVNADHAGMVPLVLPDVFNFFDRSLTK